VLGVVEAPDATWAPRLRHLLGHKPPIYRYHIERSLTEPLDALQTLYYVGLVGEVPVTVAMVAGAHGAGVYGHVYTVPEWRQRGASTLLHEAVAADTRARGYRALSLGTDPRGHARRLYEGIGYRPVLPGRGDMIWRADDGSAAGPPREPSAVGPARWDDWGWVSEATCPPPEPGEELPRSILFGVRDAGHVEAGYVAVMRDGPPLVVLRSGRAAVGWAAVLPEAARALGAAGLEFYVRPGFREEAERLLDALAWPERAVVTAVAGGPGYRARALAAHGFRPVAALGDWWDLGRGTEAATLWVRPPQGRGGGRGEA
jgi:GNAT superfamily N-acetyltransferase